MTNLNRLQIHSSDLLHESTVPKWTAGELICPNRKKECEKRWVATEHSLGRLMIVGLQSLVFRS